MDFPKSMRMKKILLLLVFVSVADSLKAQARTKTLLQQIAALQVYIGYAKKGYNIAREGLNTIGSFTRGEFDLHTEYFNSLKTVNPEVKRYVKVAEIIALQVRIAQNYNRAYRQLKNSGAFSGDELAYISRVFSRLLDDCVKTLDELTAIITNEKLQMKDDERMERIDKLYLDMQDKLTFSESFSNDAKSLAASRLKEKSDIQTISVLQGIKN